ncbi:MAG: YIP1 family protein [Euryarchaeota archaeon]|nr:YIP1 family protein [Euryarchaeota archaeon]
MAERARRGMALGLPAACTLTLGALGNINIFNYAPKELFARFFPEPPLLALALLGAIGISMFTLFLTALYRFVSVLLGGAGTYMKMLELVGAASLPLAVSQGILLPLGALGLPQKMAGPLAGLLLIPFVTWYFYLLLQAIHHSTELPMDRSAAVILIPLAAGALLGAAMLPNLQQFQGSLGRTGG